MSVEKTVDDLQSLKIQGASKVKQAVLLELKDLLQKDKSKNTQEFLKKFKHTAKLLAFARATEPETRNVVRKILLHSVQEKYLEKNSLHELKRAMLSECNDCLFSGEKSMKEIALHAQKLFNKKSIVFTHCHSHTVEDILVKAFNEGKLSRVIATETRPRFQGRITVTNLTKHGVPCTLIVDSAAHLFMKEADLFFSGADALLADGSIVNKIGTRMVSDYALQNNVPHYVGVSSLAFDPETFFEKTEPIEERNAVEVFEKKLHNLTIRNPAFDLTPAENIKAIVSEYGVLSPKDFSQKMIKELGLRSGKFVSLNELLK